MNPDSIWCKRKAEAACGAPESLGYAVKITWRAIFTANDSKLKKKR
jgi:hypothetical protein